MTRSILYIEDNPDNMRLVQRALENRGYSFVGAINGKEGLELANELFPDIILLDINLPDIDGYEVVKRVKLSKDHRLRNVPVIAITANAMKVDELKAMDAGCDMYLTKPIDINELWACVDAILSD